MIKSGEDSITFGELTTSETVRSFPLTACGEDSITFGDLTTTLGAGNDAIETSFSIVK